MRIIPAIDIIDGKCVRLEEGDYQRKKVYNENPLEIARQFEAHGIQYLHLVDLDGAKAGKLINTKVIEQICSQTSLSVDIGGGIKSDVDLKIAFECGASQVNVGSLAVKNKALFLSWIEQFGAEKMILSADAKAGKIAINGWQTVTDIDLLVFLGEYLEAGITTAVCTDIAKDGMMQGPSFDLYKEIMGKYPDLNLVASGGVSRLADVEKLSEMNLYGTIIGKAIYEGTISLPELKKFNH